MVCLWYCRLVPRAIILFSLILKFAIFPKIIFRLDFWTFQRFLKFQNFQNLRNRKIICDLKSMTGFLERSGRQYLSPHRPVCASSHPGARSGIGLTLQTHTYRNPILSVSPCCTRRIARWWGARGFPDSSCTSSSFAKNKYSEAWNWNGKPCVPGRGGASAAQFATVQNCFATVQN